MWEAAWVGGAAGTVDAASVWEDGRGRLSHQAMGPRCVHCASDPSDTVFSAETEHHSKPSPRTQTYHPTRGS